MNRSDILRPRVTPVAVPGWDASGHVRSMSGAHRERYIGFRRDDGSIDPLHAGYVIAWCLCDAQGERVFQDTEDEARLIWESLGCAAVDALYKAAIEASSMTVDAVKDAEGNSSATLNSGSG